MTTATTPLTCNTENKQENTMQNITATAQQILEAKIPPRYVNMNAENFVTKTEEQKNIIGVFEEYLLEFKRIKRLGETLVLSGDTGIGKTHIACAILNIVLANGHNAFFLDAKDIVDFTKGDMEGVDFIVIDDLEEQWVTAHERNMHGAFDKLYSANIPFLLTTCLSIDGLRFYLGKKRFDRLFEGNSYLVELLGESHRGGTPQN